METESIYPRQERPIFMKVEDGRFVCGCIFEGVTLLFDYVAGRLAGICAGRYKGFLYWHIVLIDNQNSNRYAVVFPYTSSLFQQVALRLATAKRLNNITLEPYKPTANYSRRRHSGINVYADGVLLQPLQVHLPKIRCIKFGRHIHKDYSPRLEAIRPIIAGITSRCKASSTRAQ